MNLNNVILFDGKCKLCNFWVSYVIKNDKKKIFRFCPIQSKLAKKILKTETITLDTIYLLKDNQVFTRFYASTYVIYRVNRIYFLLYVFNFLLPKKLLNFFYNTVGKNRYKLFGKYDKCLVPSKNLEDRFIND